MRFKYSYKVFSEITIYPSHQEEQSIELKQNSQLIYDLEIEIKAIEETFRQSGVLKNDSKQQYIGDDEEKKLKIDTLKLIGYFFERSDCALRNHELKNVIRSFQNQMDKLYEPKNEYREILNELAQQSQKAINMMQIKPEELKKAE